MLDEIIMTGSEVTDEYLITREFKTATEFSQFIEKKSSENGVPCMDLLVDYCIKKDIEIESVAVLLTSSLKEKIRSDAEELNLLKRKSGKLPL